MAKDNQVAKIKSWNLTNRCMFPNTQKNLVSIKKLNEQNESVHFDANRRIVQDDRCFPLKCEHNLFCLQVHCLHGQSNAPTASLQLWHERLAHNNKIDVRNLAKAVVAMKLVVEGNESCDVCNTEKAKRLPIPRQIATRAKKQSDIFHVDLPPVNTTSIDIFKHALGFVGSFSRLGAVYLLRTRAEVGTKLLRFEAEIGNDA